MRRNKIDLFCHQGEDGWEEVDDDEAEGIEVSGGSPFAPASDYFGETFIIYIKGKKSCNLRLYIYDRQLR